MATDIGCPASEVQRIWEAALVHIRTAVIDGRAVVFMNLGTLDPVMRKTRRMYSLRSGEYVRLPERRSVRFIPSRNLREEL